MSIRSHRFRMPPAVPFALIAACILGVSSCSLLRGIAGAELDPEQFRLAREARMMEVRASAAAALQKRLAAGDPIDNADVLLFINERLLNKAAAQLDSSRGWLDQETRMLIRHASVRLYNGAAILTLDLDAASETYPVAVRMKLDCLLYLALDEKQRLAGRMEAFNISPEVETGGLLAGQEELVRNIISLRLASMGERLPPFILPLDFSRQTAIDGVQFRTREKIDMTIASPRRLVETKFRLKEILLFESKALVALDVAGAAVK